MSQDAPIRRLEIVRGHNFESRCFIELRRIVGRGRFIFPRPSMNMVDIVWTQKSPPANGDYELSVGDQTVNVRYAGGRWMGSTYKPSAARLKSHPQIALGRTRPASNNAT